MQDVFRRSSVHFIIWWHLQIYLCAYVHIFSTGDTGLGYYKGVYHYIRVWRDTGIKQLLCRIPIHFCDEEEGHLESVRLWNHCLIGIWLE